VVLLRASWLTRLARAGGALPRREELPSAALWEPSKLFSLGERMLGQLQKGGHVAFLPIVSVSMARPSQEQPHPNQMQMQTLAVALELICSYLTKAFKEIECPTDCGVFLDRCSLRNTTGSCGFDASAMEEMGLWYGHGLVRKLLIGTDAAIEEDGVAFLQLLFSSMISQHQLVLRLGNSDSVARFQDWPALRKACVVGRSPPLTPEATCALLDSRRFSSSSECKAAQVCYRTTFESAAGNCQQLVLANLGWGVEEARLLANALPHCHSLTELFLEGNCLSNAGTECLASALPRCLELKEVLLANNQIGNTGAKALAQALGQCRKLERLELHGNAIGEVGAANLAAALPTVRCLRDLLLQDNHLGDLGAQAVAAVLPSCAYLKCLVMDRTGAGRAAGPCFAEAVPKALRLQLLHLEGTHVTEGACKALQEAWLLAGKPERSLLNGTSYPALML